MNKSTIRQDEQRRRYRVGSTYFFSNYPGFQSKDIDEIEFEEEPKLYKNVLQFHKRDKSRCLFKWRKMTPNEFIEYTLHSKLPMELGKFLVPEVVDYLGFTLDHLKQLAPVVEKLDKKHNYEKVIFDSYIENNGFYLTQEQRDRAYQIYIQERV